MKAFCITIPRLIDRQIYIKEAWNFLDFEFFYGVDYKFHDVFQIIEALGKQSGTKEAPKLAIYLSHLFLWKELLQRSEDGWLIFEDDCKPLLPEVLLHPRQDFIKYHVPNPKRYLPWIGTACYWADRCSVQLLYDYPIADSPDVVVHNVIRPLIIHFPKAAGVHSAFGSSYFDPIKQLTLL